MAHSVEDYRPWFEHPTEVRSRLERLTYRHGHDKIKAWTALIDAQDWRGLVEALLIDHYDPAYSGSSSAYGWDQGEDLDLPDLEPETIKKAAQDVLRRF